jgi:hypothetical protein
MSSVEKSVKSEEDRTLETIRRMTHKERMASMVAEK